MTWQSVQNSAQKLIESYGQNLDEADITRYVAAYRNSVATFLTKTFPEYSQSQQYESLHQLKQLTQQIKQLTEQRQFKIKVAMCSLKQGFLAAKSYRDHS